MLCPPSYGTGPPRETKQEVPREGRPLARAPLLKGSGLPHGWPGPPADLRRLRVIVWPGHDGGEK